MYAVVRAEPHCSVTASLSHICSSTCTVSTGVSTAVHVHVSVCLSIYLCVFLDQPFLYVFNSMFFQLPPPYCSVFSSICILSISNTFNVQSAIAMFMGQSNNDKLPCRLWKLFILMSVRHSPLQLDDNQPFFPLKKMPYLGS